EAEARFEPQPAAVERRRDRVEGQPAVAQPALQLAGADVAAEGLHCLPADSHLAAELHRRAERAAYPERPRLGAAQPGARADQGPQLRLQLRQVVAKATFDGNVLPCAQGRQSTSGGDGQALAIEADLFEAKGVAGGV